MNSDLYSEYILEHARRPHNKKIISDGQIVHVNNPVCGDDLTLYVKLSDGKIIDCSFQSEGCALSCASASLCTDYFLGKTILELKLLTPGAVYELLGIAINPNRSNCVLLAYSALEKFLQDNMVH